MAVDEALSSALAMRPVALSDWLVVLPVVLCIALGAVLTMLRGFLRLQAPVALAGLVLLVFLNAALLARVMRDGPVTMVAGRWLPPFGIAFTADLTGALLALCAALAALAGGIYALGDIGTTERRSGFYPLLMLLMAGVSGAFLTGDIFNLYVWFEVLLISSFGLLALGQGRRQLDATLKYAVPNLIGTTMFLIAVGILYAIFGTLNMADIAARAPQLRQTVPLVGLAALMFFAFALKAAAVPLNFWLPATYHTPRLAISALFAGLLTKVGIYALLRSMVMLFPVERQDIGPVIAVVASLGMILGGLGALAQNDIRRLFGYVVISGVGTMLAGIAIGTAPGIGGAIFYALYSMVLMTALYMLCGVTAHLGGAWRLSELGGIQSRAPVFSALSLSLFLAAGGLPPFAGFWPKAILLKAALDTGAWWLASAILIGGFLTTIALARVFLLAYWRAAPQGGDRAAPAGGVAWRPSSVLPIVALSLAVAGFGLFPEPLVRLSRQAADGLADSRAYHRSVFPSPEARE